MVAERRAIRQELGERQDRKLLRYEMAADDPTGGSAELGGGVTLNVNPRDQLQLQAENLVGDHVMALLEQSGSEAGFTPAKGARDFLNAHRTFSVPGLNMDKALGYVFGHPKAATMTQTGVGARTGAGYKPFSYQGFARGADDLRDHQLHAHAPEAQRRTANCA